MMEKNFEGVYSLLNQMDDFMKIDAGHLINQSYCLLNIILI